MLEQHIKVQGAAFVCSTCNKDIPAGEVAHVLLHVETSPQQPAEIHVGFMPNHEPKKVIVVPRMAATREHLRAKGRRVVIDRRECDACNTEVRLATLRRNCFV
jgi:hypothetical protein